MFRSTDYYHDLTWQIMIIIFKICESVAANELVIFKVHFIYNYLFHFVGNEYGEFLEFFSDNNNYKTQKSHNSYPK